MAGKKQISLCTIIILFFMIGHKQVAAFIHESWYNPFYLEFHLYNRDKPHEPDIILYNDKNSLDKSSFKPRYGTIIYIHGWLQYPQIESALEVRDEILKIMDFNVIIVDWTNLAMGFYCIYSRPGTSHLGEKIANAIRWFDDQKKLNISDLHIIGFGLGAHVAGYIGRNSGTKQIRRITGIDPVATGWSNRGLEKSDAKFVDVLHTQSIFSLKECRGHVDIYVKISCSKFLCNHFFAWKFFALTMGNPKLYKIEKFGNCERNQVYNPNFNTTCYYGYYMDPNIRGLYTIQS